MQHSVTSESRTTRTCYWRETLSRVLLRRASLLSLAFLLLLGPVHERAAGSTGTLYP
jgi:hypothetical protein